MMLTGITGHHSRIEKAPPTVHILRDRKIDLLLEIYGLIDI